MRLVFLYEWPIYTRVANNVGAPLGGGGGGGSGAFNATEAIVSKQPDLAV